MPKTIPLRHDWTRSEAEAVYTMPLMDLLFHVCGELGIDSDQQLAEVADVTRENVANWREGQVKEFKLGTLEAVKRGLSARLKSLKAAAGQRASVDGHTEVEVEEGSSPSDLQRQFQELVSYDYIGHRFLSMGTRRRRVRRTGGCCSRARTGGGKRRSDDRPRKSRCGSACGTTTRRRACRG